MTAASDHSPRSASVLLSGALAHLDVIQPPDLRGPVRDILRAGIEVCVTSRSLLGKPIRPALDLAQAVMNAAAFQDDDEAGR
ncbi:hypothetical protein ACQPXB_35955 [Amycolatopsis sp. CA-161197]|uniref:hypothetical protein n=1 Tax=Amycolatopsis sp. CA-161197 TaxID=3239922 RepID=UPI003D89C690